MPLLCLGIVGCALALDWDAPSARYGIDAAADRTDDTSVDVLGAGPDAPPDASPPSDVDAGPLVDARRDACAVFDAPHSFCEDFDDPVLGRWTRFQEIPDAGVEVDDAAYSSPPFSLLAKASVDLGMTESFSLVGMTADFGRASHIVVELGMGNVLATGGGFVPIAVVLTLPNGARCTLSFAIATDSGGNTTLAYRTEGFDSGKSAYQAQDTLGFQAHVLDAWGKRLKLDVDLPTRTAAIYANGVPLGSPLVDMPVPSYVETFSLSLGVLGARTPSSAGVPVRVRVDDLWVDVTDVTDAGAD